MAGLLIGKHRIKRECRTVRDDDLRVCSPDDILFGQMQPLRKNTHQRRMEGQGTALKGDRFFDIQSLCQTADRLFGDGMEGGKRQICLGDALI